MDPGSLTRLGFGMYMTVMVLDDGMAERQAQSHTLLASHLLRAEIRVENHRQVFRRDADPGVLENNVQIFTRVEAKVIGCR